MEKKVTPHSGKISEQWWDTITEVVIEEIQEFGNWGQEYVDVEIEKEYGKLVLQISATVHCNYDIKTGMRGDYLTPDDPDEYTLTSASIDCCDSDYICIWDTEKEEHIMELKNWYCDERITR